MSRALFRLEASFILVMTRLWTAKRIATRSLETANQDKRGLVSTTAVRPRGGGPTACIASGHDVCQGNVYQVFLIQHSLDYFFWLQTYVRENGGQLPDMTVPVLVSIAAFSMQPLAGPSA